MFSCMLIQIFSREKKEVNNFTLFGYLDQPFSAFLLA